MSCRSFSWNDRNTPNFKFKSFGHFPAASQVTHPTYAEAVQTDGVTNGYFSKKLLQLLVHIALFVNFTMRFFSPNVALLNILTNKQQVIRKSADFQM